MRVALTGVSGFIGSVIARRLHEAGHSVTGLVRPSSRRDHIEPVVDRFVVGAQDDESAWPELLKDADAVVHNSVDWQWLKDEPDLRRHLESNLLASIRLLDASAPRAFVFISTIAVHHDMRPAWNGHIDEDHPLRPANWYGAYKAAVEAHLWAAHASQDARFTCAIRPCGVYGIDPRLDRSIGYPIVEQLVRERAYHRPGGGKFVHVEDVAAAVVGALAAPDAAARPFNLVDCYARWGDWARIAAELLDLEADVDLSSPPEPKNTFDKTAAQSIGADLNRGHQGIRDHLATLIDRMRTEQRL